MPYKYADKLTIDEMPNRAATRNIRYRYPWADLLPGEGFRFAPAIKIMSARVMCTNNGRELDRVFRCYRGVDEALYAIRMDGMHSELPKGEVLTAPRIDAATAPGAAEIYGDFGSSGGRPMRDNEKNIISGGSRPVIPPLPIPQKTASQLRTEQINREQEENMKRNEALDRAKKESEENQI